MKAKFSGSILAGLCSLVVGGWCAPVLADTPITGQIQFGGGANLNGSLGTATGFSSFFGPLGTGTPEVAYGSSGTYASVPVGTGATFSNFSFSPAPVTPFSLWSFSVGTTEYSFDVTSLTIAAQNASFLDLQGTGVAHVTGLTDTTGNWSITDTGTGPMFTFGNLTNVPEPATSGLILLGLTALGVRRRAAAK
ncbi:MAG TPA: PEP-CTERM sorting domain-containing protein [Verrucomicrobiae bacterium]|nr:PEP-CTERM sorting domain-containing protein [Verrucomicrobiae bacterium]